MKYLFGIQEISRLSTGVMSSWIQDKVLGHSRQIFGTHVRDDNLYLNKEATSTREILT